MGPSESVAEKSSEKRTATVTEMLSSLRRGEDRKYFVGLFGYYIEGIFYSASGLSMDLSGTQNILETEIGFCCTALFRPDLLDTKVVVTNGLTKINADGRIVDVVRVRLEVMLDDIWVISEFVDGAQHELFIDVDNLQRWLGVQSGKAH